MARKGPSTYEETGTAAGTTRTYLSTKEAYHDAQGNLVGLIGIARDITDLKSASKNNFASRRRWRPSGDSPAAWPTTSTIF